jgi:YfiH family protein
MEYDKAKLEWLEYDLLEQYPHILHGTFSRHGGVSQGTFGTLNLGVGTPDNPEHVKTNRALIQKAIRLDRIVYPHQNHGVNVHRVTAKNLDQMPQADALYTTEKNIGLAATHADCQAIILYDPVHEAVAIAHAGWRGSAQNIVGRLIDTLQRELGTQPHNLVACVSPSLGPDHAEFKNYKQELPREFWDFQKKPYHFDFWQITRMQLVQAGVLDKNIETADICTYCHSTDYFSHRREKDTGRNATIVALRSSI